MGLLFIDPCIVVNPSRSRLLISTRRTLQLRPTDTHLVYDWHLSADILRHQYRSFYLMRNYLWPEQQVHYRHWHINHIRCHNRSFNIMCCRLGQGEASRPIRRRARWRLGHEQLLRNHSMDFKLPSPMPIHNIIMLRGTMDQQLLRPDSLD